MLRLAICLTFLGLTGPALSQADDADLRALVEKAIQRVSPEKDLSKQKGHTVKMSGAVVIEGLRAPLRGELSSLGSDRQRVDITIEVGGQMIPFISVLQGDRGWRSINGSSNEMTADELDEARTNAYTGWVATLVPLRDKEFQLKPYGEVEVDGRKAVGVNVERAGRRTVVLFFDRETSHLVRVETTLRSSDTQRDVTEQTTYYDFQRTDGVEQPTRTVIRRNGEVYAEMELRDLRRVESFPDSAFAQP